MIRDKLLAFTLGAGHSLDIYYAAFRVPDFVFAVIGSLASASILLPFFIDSFGKSKEEGRLFSDAMFTVFFAIIFVVSIIMLIAAPWIMPTYFLALLMIRICLAYPLDAHHALLASVLEFVEPFFKSDSDASPFLVYAASPVVYNLGIIAGVYFLYPIIGISGLAVGVALGAFMHMGIQVPFLIHEDLMPRFTANIKWSSIKHILIVALPRTATLSTNELAEFIFISVASGLATGSISVFNLAFNLQSVPLALIGAAIRLQYSRHCHACIMKRISMAFYKK